MVSGEVDFQHLTNPLMVLLTCALQEGLIRRIYNKGVFEKIRCVRWQSISDKRVQPLPKRPSSRCNVGSSSCETA